jgi:hypothetical protein
LETIRINIATQEIGQPPHGLPRLVFDLLLDRYAPEATDELRDFCLAESISYEWASWP